MVGCSILVSWTAGSCMPSLLLQLLRLFSSVVRVLYEISVGSMQIELPSDLAIYFALLVYERGV